MQWPNGSSNESLHRHVQDEISRLLETLSGEYRHNIAVHIWRCVHIGRWWKFNELNGAQSATAFGFCESDTISISFYLAGKYTRDLSFPLYQDASPQYAVQTHAIAENENQIHSFEVESSSLPNRPSLVDMNFSSWQSPKTRQKNDKWRVCVALKRSKTLEQAANNNNIKCRNDSQRSFRWRIHTSWNNDIETMCHHWMCVANARDTQTESSE